MAEIRIARRPPPPLKSLINSPAGAAILALVAGYLALMIATAAVNHWPAASLEERNASAAAYLRLHAPTNAS